MTANLIRTATDPTVVGIAHLMQLRAPWSVTADLINAYAKQSGRSGDAIQEEAREYARRILPRLLWRRETLLAGLHDSLAESGRKDGDGDGLKPEKCDKLAADIGTFLDGEG